MRHAYEPDVIVLAGASEAAYQDIAAALTSAGFSLTHARDFSALLEAIHTAPPACILFTLETEPARQQALIRELKADHVYGHLPVLALLPHTLLANLDWRLFPVDDYLVLPLEHDSLTPRIQLCVERSARDLDANPLTGLPGNLTIMREAERRIDAGLPFAMGYIDLDHFKPFNDKYGFSRGDEVLRMMARILVNVVRSIDNPDTYVGHVGGDDFIFMVPAEYAEQVCERTLGSFDPIVKNFYDEDDRLAGYIVSEDRQGNVKHFPFMGCSIAVVDTSCSNIAHVGELSARAADLKKFAKASAGSSYLIDRRR